MANPKNTATQSTKSQPTPKVETNNVSLPTLLVIWLVASSLIVCWDAAFVILRPDSLAGGKYASFFSPYELYITIDKAYGDLHNPWTKLQSYMNLWENVMNFYTVLLNFSNSSSTVPLCIVSLSFTLSKTLLYMGMEAVEGFKNISHNSTQDLVLLYIIPNCLWILIPFLGIVWCSGASSKAFRSYKPKRD